MGQSYLGISQLTIGWSLEMGISQSQIALLNKGGYAEGGEFSHDYICYNRQNNNYRNVFTLLEGNDVRPLW
jgi:hypothetical protein